mmetsp:Transcript_10681/g.25340  ORF Transcript_10681/g.25340 Transcript_10681/m.25340 type:complete len:122 (-) Transcript_10681:12-377(-)
MVCTADSSPKRLLGDSLWSLAQLRYLCGADREGPNVNRVLEGLKAECGLVACSSELLWDWQLGSPSVPPPPPASDVDKREEALARLSSAAETRSSNWGFERGRAAGRLTFAFVTAWFFRRS